MLLLLHPPHPYRVTIGCFKCNHSPCSSTQSPPIWLRPSLPCSHLLPNEGTGGNKGVIYYVLVTVNSLLLLLLQQHKQHYDGLELTSYWLIIFIVFGLGGFAGCFVGGGASPFTTIVVTIITSLLLCPILHYISAVLLPAK